MAYMLLLGGVMAPKLARGKGKSIATFSSITGSSTNIATALSSRATTTANHRTPSVLQPARSLHQSVRQYSDDHAAPIFKDRYQETRHQEYRTKVEDAKAVCKVLLETRGLISRTVQRLQHLGAVRNKSYAFPGWGFKDDSGVWEGYLARRKIDAYLLRLAKVEAAWTTLAQAATSEGLRDWRESGDSRIAFLLEGWEVLSRDNIVALGFDPRAIARMDIAAVESECAPGLKPDTADLIALVRGVKGASEKQFSYETAGQDFAPAHKAHNARFQIATTHLESVAGRFKSALTCGAQW